MTGTDLNISFQDTQYLSELYAKLESSEKELTDFYENQKKGKFRNATVFALISAVAVGVITLNTMPVDPRQFIIITLAVVCAVIQASSYANIIRIRADIKRNEIECEILSTEIEINEIKMKRLVEEQYREEEE